ncbi:hypothetical protein MS3_00000149 [Schistosoma haematobium]|uniref:Uncharacterized protein n=1 Tax=Schistosoma haematobium TaxID=6185 RepID=A0A922S112_SCHHA|nr:hypothetical protein MS3_00000149 [Schistosoma haematobium]KAH9588444.1 hypothetical protein MS3_00000149 [Schistosoma haematobium]CAH8570610.1 unnamed protein product [Schistosoma haematobium]
MISQLVTFNVAVLFLCTFNMMNVDAFQFSAPIDFDEHGEMYIDLNNLNISLSSEYEFTASDGDCTKTIFLKPPTDHEKLFRTGLRSVSFLCKSWSLNQERSNSRGRDCLWTDLLF